MLVTAVRDFRRPCHRPLMDEVVEAFRQTFAGEGPDPTETIREAEAKLNSYGGGPDFCRCLTEIIQLGPPALPFSIRMAALTFLTRLISVHWDTDLPDESKAFLLGACPDLLVQSDLGLYSGLMKFASTLIIHSFPSGQWPDLLTVISTCLAAGGRPFLVGLILSKAVSRLILSEDSIEAYESFSAALLPAMTQLITESTSFL